MAKESNEIAEGLEAERIANSLSITSSGPMGTILEEGKKEYYPGAKIRENSSLWDPKLGIKSEPVKVSLAKFSDVTEIMAELGFGIGLSSRPLGERIKVGIINPGLNILTNSISRLRQLVQTFPGPVSAGRPLQYQHIKRI